MQYVSPVVRLPILVLMSFQITALHAEMPAPRTGEATTAGPRPTIGLPSARVGRPYSRPLIIGGGPPFSLVEVSWAPESMGLVMGSDGVLSGIPERPGAYTLDLVVRDVKTGQQTRQPYRLRVLPARSGQN
ncbi:hypothetical protein [Leptothrix discophora]|uniref:Uncharacterized protein n=1 Tax=Leptothrix discophora TaxID=89 RepID=A0ABT9G4V5_LEPDI|nr:hypothetical protein [Leptothrix discophora]MDP4301520.1 hypothetical protein [Leptothrix discophora]